MLTLKHKLLFSPDPPSSGVTGVAPTITQTKEMNKEDVIEFLNDEEEKPEVIDIDTKEPKKKDDKKEETDDTDSDTEEDEEEPDELDEIEEELKEPTEEQLELVTPVRRKEILKKYPTLFKDFPYLEKAYYREQQFTELLPTIADAKAAVEKAQVLDRFENDLLGGSTETVLKAVKETNPEGFNKLVDSYLPTLASVDENAYYHVIGNLTKHTIVAMVREAKNSNNAALQQAALLLNQFVFGTSDFKPPTNLAHQGKPEDNSREKQISEREQKFLQGQFENARVDLNTRVNNTLKNTIDANIDPKNSMSDYVRKNAARDCMDMLERAINSDARFRALNDRLWEKAFEDGFSKESTDRIRSAHVSKAKTLLPSVLKKARIEALKGTGRRTTDDEDDTPKKGPVTPGRPRSHESGKSGKIKEAKDIPKGMSTIDFLNSD